MQVEDFAESIHSIFTSGSYLYALCAGSWLAISSIMYGGVVLEVHDDRPMLSTRQYASLVPDA